MSDENQSEFFIQNPVVVIRKFVGRLVDGDLDLVEVEDDASE